MTVAFRRALLGAALSLALLGCGSDGTAPGGFSGGTPAPSASGPSGTSGTSGTSGPSGAATSGGPGGPAPTASGGRPAGDGPSASPGTAATTNRPAPPVAGTYTYALTVNGGAEQTVTVVVEAARPAGGGHSVRTRTHLGGGHVSIATITWNASGAFTTRTETSGPAGTSTATCTPPSKDLAFPLAAGTGWTYQGTCETRRTGSAEVTRSQTTIRYRCTAERALRVLGGSEPVWVLDESATTTAKGNQPNAVAATSTTTSTRELLRAYRLPGLVTSTTKDTGPDGKPRTTTTRLELRAAVPA